MSKYDDLEIQIGDATIKTENIDKVIFRFCGEEYYCGDRDNIYSEEIKATDILNKIEEIENERMALKKKQNLFIAEVHERKEFKIIREENMNLKRKIQSLEKSILKLSKE